MIASRVEAILAEQHCIVGTFAGKLYALDIANGRTVWCFTAQGPISHSPCYDQGRLYVGSDDGYLYCVKASNGKLLWHFPARAGIWVSPACDGQTVYFGDRAGVFYALEASTGKLRWSLKTGYMILTPASISLDKQRIVFASDDMHVYCVNPSGKLLWRSAKLQGLSLRDHAPTLWQGLAIVRSNPADGFHTTMGRNGEMLEAVQRKLPLTDADQVLLDKWGDLILKESATRRAAEKQAIKVYLAENPAYQTFYAFDLKTGAEPWQAQVLYTGGLHNPATPPTFNPHTGELYTFYRTAMTNYLRGIRRYSAVGRLDRHTGLIDLSWPETRHRDWANFPMIGDETQSLSLMGPVLISSHQGELGALNLDTWKQNPIWRARDTYGGIYGPGALAGSFEAARTLAQEGYLTGMPNEWHGPDRSIVSIGYGRLFWVVGSQVVCLAGPGMPKSDTGGTQAPAPMRSKLPLIQGGNLVHSRGHYDDGLPRQSISQQEIRDWVQSWPSKKADQPPSTQLRQKLEQALIELVQDGPWAPFVVELGIVREDMYFWRSAETMQVVAQSLPFVSARVQAQVKSFLANMFEQGMPLENPMLAHQGKRRREMYTYGPGMEAFTQRKIQYQATIEDLYAVWAYAHYSSEWKTVLTQLPAIKKIYQDFASRPFEFDPRDNRHDATEHLNRQISGVIAYVRIMQRAGLAQALEEPYERLARMAMARVHHERADSALIRATRGWGQGNVEHNAKIPRYCDLTPELVALLRQYADESFTNHVTGLARQLPLWYQAWQERMIGGENYVSPPHLARGLFYALSEGRLKSSRDMMPFLDQAWCKGDLYYIEKLTALCRHMQEE